MNLLDRLNWRYATKSFDTEKKVSDKDLAFLKEAIRLSVSSYGLQAYKVLVIENKEMREKLREVSWNQRQLTEASHLFVFCNYTSDFDKHVDDHIDRIAASQDNKPDGLVNYGEFVKTKIDEMSAHQRQSWSEKQTYLALKSLLVACAELEIDACPMKVLRMQTTTAFLG